jgi:hypothetical protein
MRITLVALVVVSLSSCKPRPKPEPNGLGPWEFGKTTLADARKRTSCLQNGEYWECMPEGTGMQSIKVGEQASGLKPIFRGADDKAPLVEIYLEFRACQVPAVTEWLVKTLGKPDEGSSEKKAFWTKKLMFVGAFLPAKGGTCEISFVTIDDAERIKYLKEQEI